MSLFVIADLHLSFGANKPMNIFRGWDNYEERLEKNWRSLVTDEDIVVIPGDISWAMKLNECYEDFKFIHNLPGKKLLLKGNHDYWWDTRRKIENYLRENGFDSIEIVFNSAKAVGEYAVCGTRGWFYDAEADSDKKVLNREVGRLRTSITEALKTGLEPVVFLHYPPVYGDQRCDDILNVLKEYNIKKCYYGHLHGSNVAKKAVTGEFEGINFKLISSDYVKFVPILVR